MVLILVIIGVIRITQTDWVSGPGVVIPVTDWGKGFYNSDSITYNVQGQVSPVASGTVNYGNWTKHIIDTDANIINHSIVAADLDGDGDLDLAGWKGNGNILQFYRNDGGTFTKVSANTGPYSGAWSFISAADFNNDGKMDVLVSEIEDVYQTYGGLMWFKNNGNFSFTGYSISSAPYLSVETGDINNDGKADVIAGCAFYSYVDIWKNNGSGCFTKNQTLSTTSWRLRLDDLDNDGDKDLLVGDPYTTGKILIYFNDGNGTFTQVSSLNAPYVDGLWSRDFDNDGFQDILCGSGDGSTYFNLYWFRNLGDGMNYEMHTVYAAGNMNYGDGGSAEDFDMDGKADVVSSFAKLAFFRQNTFDNFTEYPIDNYGASYSHWVIPIPLDRGTCAKLSSVDFLVCYQGNFAWYENNMVSKFSANSYLESSILKAQCTDVATWLYFGYEVCEPFSGAISFQFRVGNSSAEIMSASWSTPVLVPAGTVKDSISLAGFPATKLFQYRVNCTGTTDVPVIYEVWVTYVCGYAGNEEKHLFPPASLQIQGNEICYSLPQKANIDISLYDITGRLVKIIENREQEAGTYRVTVSGLKSGIYFVVFSNDGVKTTRKMVLIK